MILERGSFASFAVRPEFHRVVLRVFSRLRPCSRLNPDNHGFRVNKGTRLEKKIS